MATAKVDSSTLLAHALKLTSRPQYKQERMASVDPEDERYHYTEDKTAPRIPEEDPERIRLAAQLVVGAVQLRIQEIHQETLALHALPLGHVGEVN